MKKPRCPKCNRVARKLYHRSGPKAAFASIPDAAECPTHGAFLTP